MKQYPQSLAALAVCALTLASCSDGGHHHIAFATPAADFDAPASGPTTMAPTPPKSKPAATDARIVLVTIDGVRAEDVFEGANPSLRPGAKVEHLRRPEAVMPRMHRLVATRGVALGAEKLGCGIVRTASGANVSLPGYLEIFTGRKTRCRDNKCAPVAVPTVLDEAAEAGASPVASIGSWDVLDRAVSNGSVKNGSGANKVLVAEGVQPWPAARPLADGMLDRLVMIGEHAEAFPGVGKYRPDETTMAISLAYLRSARPQVFHIGLGDSDEWGHRNDYRAYLDAIGRADSFIGELADTLDAMGDVGAHTTVIVTTDHGRNRDFQHHGTFSGTSARTFVMAFGAHVPVRGVVACPSHDVSLADIAPTMRVLLGLPADTSPDAGRPIEEIAPAAPREGSRDYRVAGGPPAGGGGSSASGIAQRP